MDKIDKAKAIVCESGDEMERTDKKSSLCRMDRFKTKTRYWIEERDAGKGRERLD